MGSVVLRTCYFCIRNLNLHCTHSFDFCTFHEVLNLYMSQKYRLCLHQQQNRIKADGTFSSNVKDTD